MLLPYINMNLPSVYTCSPSWTPLPPPSPYHWNMYNIICEMNQQSRFDAWYRMLGAGALGWLPSFLRLPSRDGSPSLPLLSFFLSFIFCPTSFWRQWVAFLGAWCLLPASRSCFVEFASAQMFFWWICGGENSLPILVLHHLRTASESFLLYKVKNFLF